MKPAAPVSAFSLEEINPATTRILIVDDEPHVRLGCVLALKSEGYDVRGEGSPTTAFERVCAGENYELLILDYMMPNMDGLQLAEELGKKYVRPSVLLMSAHADGQVAARAFQLGIVDFLPKPLIPDELRVRVRRILSRERLFSSEKDLQSSMEMTENACRDRALFLAQHGHWNEALQCVRSLPRNAVTPDISLIEGLACEMTHDRAGAEKALAQARFSLDWRAGGPEIFSALANRL